MTLFNYISIIKYNMKLFEEFDAQYLGLENHSIYQHNKACDYMIKNSLKFFLLNTSEETSVNCLAQYELLKSIDASPVIFTSNLDFFINNNVLEKNLVETDDFSFINCFNEIIKYASSNYIFIINSNIILEFINEIVNRFYVTHQSFSNKVAGWSINIKNTFKNKILDEFKIDDNIYFSPTLPLDFFCIKSDYLKKVGSLSYINKNEDCQGLDYLFGWLVNKNGEYLISDLNIGLDLIEEKNKKSNQEKLDRIIINQNTFFEVNKNVYGLNDDFLGFWKGNLLQFDDKFTQ